MDMTRVVFAALHRLVPVTPPASHQMNSHSFSTNLMALLVRTLQQLSVLWDVEFVVAGHGKVISE
jgi:hypothetical protein